MLWIIQENLFQEREYENFLAACDRQGINYRTVKIIPFSHELVPEIIEPNPILVFGSTTLVRIAQERGWKPGAFYNKNFNFKVWSEAWGANILNYRAKTCTISQMKTELNKFFVRPCEDLKYFNGTVIIKDSLNEWKAEIFSQSNYLTEDTEVVISEVKTIYKEFRFFVIDSKLVTGSLYKLGNRRCLDKNIEPDAHRFASKMIKLWQPDRAFVIDIALTEEGYKIVEVNCINSAGFYAAEVSKIVNAMQEVKI
ncbi:MAG TPA: ATP-grasp domain-containing protein [Coleofasciculaceae cyanobacterium]